MSNGSGPWTLAMIIMITLHELSGSPQGGDYSEWFGILV